MENRRYFLASCGLAYLCLLYENRLLSLVTATLPPSGFTILKELLDSGFKIICPLEQYSPAQYFTSDFQRLGIFDRLTESFITVNNFTGMEAYVDKLTEGNQKLAMVASTSLSSFTKREMHQRMVERDPLFSCFTLEQTLNSRFYTWKINTENSYWIKRTIAKIKESGLFEQWDRWATWNYLLWLKLAEPSNERSFNPNYILLQNVLPIMIVVCVVFLVCAFIFCCESKKTLMASR